MNYQEALQYIHNTMKFGSKLGLHNITELLRRLGNPQNEFRSVHIAGTNGKGSVTAMTASILYQAGYKVGMFISPYLEQFTERIQVNFQEIPKEELAHLTGLVKESIDEMVRDGLNHPTEFEIVTALGFLWFARQKVDVAVVEVGLGGRLDATNVITPMVSVITSISYDHTKILGHTLSEIAYEKGGIIKPGVPVVSYPQQPEAEKVVKDLAGERGCECFFVSPCQIEERHSSITVQRFDFSYNDELYEDLVIHLPGKHQMLNAACALTCVMVLRKLGLMVDRDAVYEGLDKARWPGRLEKMGDNPEVFIDGAHNPSGAQALADAVRLYYPDSKVHLIYGVLRDKDVDTVTQTLCSIASRVIITKPDNPRAAEPDDLAAVVKRYHNDVSICPDLRKAINNELDLICAENQRNESGKGILIISGSLFLVGKARTILREMNR